MRKIAYCVLAVSLSSIWGLQGITQDRLAAIEGFVTTEEGARPLRGVEVTLLGPAGMKSSLTDDEGHFVIDGLTPGGFQVALAKDGFVRPRSGIGPSQVSLLAGQRLKQHYRLAPGAVIAGRVVDDRGNPRSGITILATRVHYVRARQLVPTWYPGIPGWSAGAPTDRTALKTTDETGDYRLYGLEAGVYFVVASKRGGSSPWYYPGVFDPSDAGLVSVSPGSERTGVDIVLRQRAEHSVRLKLVFETTPSPARIDVIQVIRWTSNGLEALERTGGRDWVHGEDLSIPGLTPGSYQVYYTTNPGAPDLASMPVRVGDDDVDAGTLVVRSPQRIDGVVDAPRGTRVSGIHLQSLDGQLISPTAPTPVDPNGRFALRAHAGRYQVAVLGLPVDAYVAGIRWAGRAVTNKEINIDAMGAGQMEITIGALGGIVQGIIRDSKDGIVTDGTVALVPREARRDGSELFKTGAADQNGEFVIRGVQPGDYSVLAWRGLEAARWVDPEMLKIAEGQGNKVTVSSGATSLANVSLRSGK